MTNLNRYSLLLGLSLLGISQVTLPMDWTAILASGSSLGLKMGPAMVNSQQVWAPILQSAGSFGVKTAKAAGPVAWNYVVKPSLQLAWDHKFKLMAIVPPVSATLWALKAYMNLKFAELKAQITGARGDITALNTRVDAGFAAVNKELTTVQNTQAAHTTRLGEIWDKVLALLAGQQAQGQRLENIGANVGQLDSDVAVLDARAQAALNQLDRIQESQATVKRRQRRHARNQERIATKLGVDGYEADSDSDSDEAPDATCVKSLAATGAVLRRTDLIAKAFIAANTSSAAQAAQQ